jgi:drug/metabolite transporter (DMT)-like permease
MEGVWIAPVMAQVIMTLLLDFVADLATACSLLRSHLSGVVTDGDSPVDWRYSTDKRRSSVLKYAAQLFDSAPVTTKDNRMDHRVTAHGLSAVAIGIACGVGAAVFWAAGLVAARHGIAIGLSPADMALHRYVWSGLALLPLVLANGAADLRAIGWFRAIVLSLLGGPLLAMISYAGFLLVPLGHGAVIQPSCAAVSGLLLATVILKEKLPLRRAAGALIIVAGLMVIAGEALATIGTHGLLGDFSFAAAGLMFATFGMLLRLWRITAIRSVGIVSLFALIDIPIHGWLFGFERLIAAGFFENFLQALVQGVFAGPASTYLFTRSVVVLGAGRAAVFPSLVPGFTLLIGFLVLGEVPSLLQLLGFGIVLAGFRLTQRG